MGLLDGLLGPPSVMPPTPPPGAPARPRSPPSSDGSSNSEQQCPTGSGDTKQRPLPQQRAVKQAPQLEEGNIPKDEEERRATTRAGAGRGRYHTARGGVTGSSSVRYASAKGKASSRFQAMTARDAEQEAAERARELRRRDSARRTARRAASSRTPLPSSRPPQAAWRKLPSGLSAAERSSGAPQLDDLWAQVEQQVTGLGGPPMPQEQDETVYGSQRPLTAKERQYQAEKMEEIAARKRLIQMREQEKERKAVAKYEMKRKELEGYRKAAIRPKSELKAEQERAKAIRERLNAVREREQAWRERVTA